MFGNGHIDPLYYGLFQKLQSLETKETAAHFCKVISAADLEGARDNTLVPLLHFAFIATSGSLLDSPVFVASKLLLHMTVGSSFSAANGPIFVLCSQWSLPVLVCACLAWPRSQPPCSFLFALGPGRVHSSTIAQFSSGASLLHWCSVLQELSYCSFLCLLFTTPEILSRPTELLQHFFVFSSIFQHL